MLDDGMEHNCVFTKKINKINTLSNTSALGLCMGSFVKQILTKSQNSLDHLEGRSRKGGSDLKFWNLKKKPLKPLKIFFSNI